MAQTSVETKIFDSTVENKWCPGCGNFGILKGMKTAFTKSDLTPETVLVISGIGQAAKTPHFLKCNMFHTLHGRALPIAMGAKAANHDLNILVNSGDGDCYGEGGNHFMNAIRKNPDITLLVHNNKVYGLTKGQASPTSDMGMVTKFHGAGVDIEPFNPVLVALSLGAGFVARSFSSDSEHLSELIVQGINHNGLAFIDILQPCVTFNKINTHKWYKEKVYDLKKTDHNTSDLDQAMNIAKIWGKKIPIGLIYKADKPVFRDASSGKKPVIDESFQPEKIRKIIDGLKI